MTISWTALTFLTAVLLAVSLIALALGHLLAEKHFSQSKFASHPFSPPSVSLLKPVEDSSRETYTAFESFCRIDYPGKLELLVGTIDRDNPIIPIVERLRSTFPDREIRWVLADLKGANRKTSIMEALWREASGEYLFFSDADVVAAPDYLNRLVPLLRQPDVGCVTCLPRGIRAQTLGARIIALHYDFSYLPQWMLAMRTTGIEWAIGHTMAIPRKVLAQLDGFTRFLDHLADDYELGNRTAALGLRILVPPYLLDCLMPKESVREAFRRLQRWKRTMRRARGTGFLGIALTYPVFWAMLLVLLHPLSWWSWANLGGTVILRGLLAARLQSWVRLPDWRRSWWLLPWLDLFEGLTFLGAYTGKTVYWAGRRYRLLRNGTLVGLDKTAPHACAKQR